LKVLLFLSNFNRSGSITERDVSEITIPLPPLQKQGGIDIIEKWGHWFRGFAEK
jgi:restriction endonuclease S subunit